VQIITGVSFRKNVELLTRAFVTYVRSLYLNISLLEYNSVIWSPNLKRDIALLEQVHQATARPEGPLPWWTFDTIELREIRIA